MDKLIAINDRKDIPVAYQDSPIGLLVEYHNLGRPYEAYQRAQMLIGMCMDNRKHLHIPDNFSFIIRAGGANMRYSEFMVSYAIGVGGIEHIALIGHNNCGMVNLVSRREAFVDGLVEKAGWDMVQAQEHFQQFAPLFEIGNSVEFILTETKRLRLRYPKLHIAPLHYLVEDNKLYFVRES
jgi:carbonic anhydrase